MDANVSRAERFELEIGAAIQRWTGKPVKWGKDDCLIALADIYLAIDGIDLAARFRGRYRGEKGARRELGRRGALGACAAAARRLGYVQINPARALSGGLGLAPTPAGPTGVIRYRGFWIGRADCGFRSFASDQLIRAWDRECLKPSP